MRIDLFKHKKVTKPVVCGLVLKVTSPKGIREYKESIGTYHYNLHTQLIQIYEGEKIDLEPGLYWVVDIAKNKEFGLHWNHYLFIVDEDEATLAESYINVRGSDWIVEAMPVIKGYFRKEEK